MTKQNLGVQGNVFWVSWFNHQDKRLFLSQSEQHHMKAVIFSKEAGDVKLGSQARLALGCQCCVTLPSGSPICGHKDMDVVVTFAHGSCRRPRASSAGSPACPQVLDRKIS